MLFRSDWRFVSYMIVYMFQCHSPKSSYPLPLPQSPKDCSIHLCLFCCLIYGVIVTIFLNSIYSWVMEKSREFQKKIYFCFLDYAKAFDCVDHNKLWKILRKIGIPDHLSCLLRNLYAGQEATVRTGHETTNWFQIGKGVRQGCI